MNNPVALILIYIFFSIILGMLGAIIYDITFRKDEKTRLILTLSKVCENLIVLKSEINELKEKKK